MHLLPSLQAHTILPPSHPSKTKAARRSCTRCAPSAIVPSVDTLPGVCIFPPDVLSGYYYQPRLGNALPVVLSVPHSLPTDTVADLRGRMPTAYAQFSFAIRHPPSHCPLLSPCSFPFGVTHLAPRVFHTPDPIHPSASRLLLVAVWSPYRIHFWRKRPRRRPRTRLARGVGTTHRAPWSRYNRYTCARPTTAGMPPGKERISHPSTAATRH